MKVSIIVPVYRVETYMARCAKSLLQQTYGDKEILFVDDASPDQSVAILEALLPAYPNVSVRVVRHATNRGLAAARLTGLTAAKGDYIVSVDSDDYLEPNALDLLVQQAQETDADIVGMDGWFEWGEERRPYHGTWSSDAGKYTKYLLNGRTLPGVCLHMVRRDLYTRSGLKPIEGLNNGEDYALMPRLAYFANTIARVTQPVYHYTQTNPDSFTHIVSPDNIRQLIRAVEVLTAFFADKPAYEQALRAGQWLKKTDLFLRADRNDYALVQTMPANAPLVTTTMTIPQRLAARLVARERWTVLWHYSRIYQRWMTTIQKMKGRQ